MDEQMTKRLVDALRLFSVLLEQMDELLWILKDLIEDLSKAPSPLAEGSQ